MPVLDVIAVFDVGKTNKKLLLFNADYQVVWEKIVQLPEVTDEDGDPCEDLAALDALVRDTLDEVCRLPGFAVKAVNFAAYGASLVYVDENGQALTPLYNYLKPYPPSLQKKFYRTYGGEAQFALETASPVLGSLNSGLQLYRLKYLQPRTYWKLDHALHLPQYLAFRVTGSPVTEITSLGCHTGLWNFRQDSYHQWVYEEMVADFFPPLVAAQSACTIQWAGQELKAGTGLHDSSAALVPYLLQFREPFLLLSTGTWNISMNPFNANPLTAAELEADCLCYLTYTAQPVKASRLFGGHLHARFVQQLVRDYRLPETFFHEAEFHPGLLAEAPPADLDVDALYRLLKQKDPLEAYHIFMQVLVQKQAEKIHLVTHDAPVQKILVDGGFSHNKVFMGLLAQAFPGLSLYAASMAQASALGAALVLHDHWNPKPMPATLVRAAPFTAIDHSPKHP